MFLKACTGTHTLICSNPACCDSFLNVLKKEASVGYFFFFGLFKCLYSGFFHGQLKKNRNKVTDVSVGNVALLIDAYPLLMVML